MERLRALSRSTGRAEEVEVLAAMPPHSSLEDQSSFDTFSLPAGTAVEGALEIVVVDSPAFASLATGTANRLHSLVEFIVDQAGLLAFKFLSVVGDEAEVVPRSEHLMHLVHGDRS